MTRGEKLDRVAAAFWRQGDQIVWVATCCGRLYCGDARPHKCRACGAKPPAVEWRAGERADNVLDRLAAEQTAGQP